MSDEKNAVGTPEEPEFDVEDDAGVDSLVASIKEFLLKFDLGVKLKLKPKKAQGGNSTAEGTGLEDGMVNIPSQFTVNTKDNNGNPLDHGDEPVKVVVKGPEGEVPCEVKDNGDGTYDCVFTPLVAGPHTVEPIVRDEPVAGAPYKIDVVPEVPDASQCTAEGPGVEPTGGAVHGVETPFVIKSINKIGNPMSTGGFPFKVAVEAPSGNKETCDDAPATAEAPSDDAASTGASGVEAAQPPKVEDKGDGTYPSGWTPKEKGLHKVSVTLNDEPIVGSPFEVDVAANPDYPDASQCEATGPGVEGGSDTASPADFVIVSKKPNGDALTKGGFPFSVTVADPEGDDVPVTLTDKDDGTYAGVYQPKKSGVYKVDIALHNPHLLPESEAIKGSTFSPEILAGIEASKCLIEGDGLKEANDCEPAKFKIISKDCNGDAISEGGHPFKVEVTDPEGNAVEAKINDNGDGTYDVEYNPDGPGKHRIRVTLGDEDVEGSPCDVEVEEGVDPNSSGIDSFSFTIQAKNKQGVVMTSGGSVFDVKINGPEADVDAEMIKIDDQGDGKYKVTYKIEEQGLYTINCLLNNRHIQSSPWKQEL